MITVVTWNVLHRVHADNWGEDVVAHWPEESARIAAITSRVKGRTEQVIALQEVSGDQLASLRVALPDRNVLALRYPRVPTPRRGPSPLHDRAEYLVLLVDGPAHEVTAESFPNDPGKGALAVQVAGTLVVATHISVDERRTPQLARLAELAATTSGHAAVLLGDFNTDRATVAAGLGPGFTVAPDTLPTRPGTSDSDPMFIDHVIVRGATADGVGVDDSEGLSDHNPVHADIIP